MSKNGKREDHHDALQREVLPIPNEPYAGPVLYDANDPAGSSRRFRRFAHRRERQMSSWC